MTGGVNPEQTGTKSAAHLKLTVPAGGSVTLRLRLGVEEPSAAHFGDAFDETFAQRIAEADEFYAELTPDRATPDEALIYRQALSGMLWTKQYYYYDLDYWLQEHDSNPFAGGNRTMRNRDWFHMANEHIISMPDKWEYPWYASWDLAFHTLALQLVDPDFAKGQLRLMLDDAYLHPNGQIPAYEWNFGDVNPPVHAFATLFNYINGPQTATREEELGLSGMPSTGWCSTSVGGSIARTRRPQRVQRRLSGHGQHRRLRSQFTAADGRLSRAGRRHCLDGALLAEHA